MCKKNIKDFKFSSDKMNLIQPCKHYICNNCFTKINYNYDTKKL